MMSRSACAGLLVCAMLGVRVLFPVPGLGPSATPCVEAADQYHVALVVEHSSSWSTPNRVLTRCIGFDGSTPTFDSQRHTITGEEVLRLSGLKYQDSGSYYSYGRAVCQIDQEPESYPPGCFDSNSPYWAMFVSHAGGSWATSSYGISQQMFGDGDAEGFHFVSQSGGFQPPPTAAGICPAPQPAASTPPPGPPAPPAPPSASHPAIAPPAGSTTTTAMPAPGGALLPSSEPPSTVPSGTTSTGPDQQALAPSGYASPTRYGPPAIATPPGSSGSHPGLVGWLVAAAVAVIMVGMLVARLVSRA